MHSSLLDELNDSRKRGTKASENNIKTKAEEEEKKKDKSQAPFFAADDPRKGEGVEAAPPQADAARDAEPPTPGRSWPPEEAEGPEGRRPLGGRRIGAGSVEGWQRWRGALSLPVTRCFAHAALEPAKLGRKEGLRQSCSQANVEQLKLVRVQRGVAAGADAPKSQRRNSRFYVRGMNL